VKLAPNHEANRALASASTLVSPSISRRVDKRRTSSSINVKNDKSGPEAEVGESKGVQGGSRDSGHISCDLDISNLSLIIWRGDIKEGGGREGKYVQWHQQTKVIQQTNCC
jgi:hypothetical protein